MKTSPRSVLLVSLALVGGLLVTGCQTGSQSPALTKGATASGSVASAADAVTTVRAQIDPALAALRALVGQPQDIPAQYKVVLAELNKLQEGESKVAAATAKMRAQGDKYLADWARQIATITDPALRDAAFIRRGEVSAKLQGIFQSYQQVQAAYLPFQNHLGDIKKVLGTDLSAQGLAAVQPFVAKAVTDAEPLKTALEKLASDFRAVGASLQPGGQ